MARRFGPDSSHRLLVADLLASQWIPRASVLAHAILFVGLHERIPRSIVARHATENSPARYSSPDTGSKLNLCRSNMGVTQRCLLSLIGRSAFDLHGNQCAKSQSMN